MKLKIRTKLRSLKRILSLLKNDLVRKYPSKWFYEKPKGINLNAIDICNSKCSMCNIWTKKDAASFSSGDLAKYLSDSLFSEVEAVGVTGGEPTLRDDLLDIYSTLIEKLPSLKGLSIITNAIKVDDCYDKIVSIANLCEQSSVAFSVMISVDGLEEEHDKTRGIPGNFESAISLFSKLEQHEQIPVSFGCTLTSNNINNLDEYLYFLKKNNIHARFRIAEFINRLYNDNKTKVIRNFTDDQRYRLQVFFQKLIQTFEPEYFFQRTYLNIISMLGGAKRSIGCPYQKEGVVISARGDLGYCAPKLEDIGNLENQGATELYLSNFSKRVNLINTKCGDCIHDYHAPESLKEIITRKLDHFLKKTFLDNESHYLAIKIATLLKLSKKNTKEKKSKKTLITGWYGTETVGDKAILAGIVKELNPSDELLVTSLYPFVTVQTLKELNIKAKVVPLYSFDCLHECSLADNIIIGGGPLMDIDEMVVLDLLFKVGKKHGANNIVWGCGVGPLNLESTRKTLSSIFFNSSIIKLRDQGSVDLGKGFIRPEFQDRIEKINCPARDYLSALKSQELPEVTNKDSFIACFLRDWTYEYARSKYSYDEYLAVKADLDQEIFSLISKEAKRLNIRKVKLFHMHRFIVGNDDLDYSISFKERFDGVDGINISYDSELSTVESIANAMRSSNLNICMRFHSVLFAETLNTEFKAIDYTLGGKIRNYLTDKKRLDSLVEIATLTI